MSIMTKLMVAGVSSAAMLAGALPIVANAADTPTTQDATLTYQQDGAAVINHGTADFKLPTSYGFNKASLNNGSIPGTQVASTISIVNKGTEQAYTGGDTFYVAPTSANADGNGGLTLKSNDLNNFVTVGLYSGTGSASTDQVKIGTSTTDTKAGKFVFSNTAVSSPANAAITNHVGTLAADTPYTGTLTWNISTK